jgi:hypothetical protein
MIYSRSMRLFAWLKQHTGIALVLVLLLGYFLFGGLLRSLFGVNTQSLTLPPSAPSRGMTDSFGALGSPSIALSPTAQFEKSLPSAPSGVDRMVVSESNLSLLVKDVRAVGDEIVSYAQQIGGFMVATSYNRPSESPFATITIRVPSDKFDEVLRTLRAKGIKVTNENLIGTDITEQYVDLDARIATLEKTKAKFETILENATTVNDTLTVNREIITLQTQIDNLTGQKLALEKQANLSKVTVYLSTDELALPYTPDTTLRPEVVFKLAVRSLNNTLRLIAEAAIWAGVYAVIWLPLLIVYFIVKRLRKPKVKQSPSTA